MRPRSSLAHINHIRKTRQHTPCSHTPPTQHLTDSMLSQALALVADWHPCRAVMGVRLDWWLTGRKGVQSVLCCAGQNPASALPVAQLVVEALSYGVRLTP